MAHRIVLVRVVVLVLDLELLLHPAGWIQTTSNPSSLSIL